MNSTYQSMSAADKVLFASVPGFTITATSVAQAIRNSIIIINELLQSVRGIESTCCAFDCDDVKIGFVVGFEDGLEVVRIRFTSGSGTSISTGFVDVGSIMTVTDESNNSVSFPVTIENNGEVVVNLLGLTPGDKLTFSIESKHSNDAITCSKCTSRTVDSAGACNFCEITAIGAGTVTIIYEI